MTTIDIDAIARDAHDKLCADGGATLSLLGGELSPVGYVVGNGSREYVTRTCTVDTIRQYIADNIDALTARDVPVYLGIWQGPDAVYLDVSEWYATSGEASFVADLRGELAVYDIAARRSAPPWTL